MIKLNIKKNLKGAFGDLKLDLNITIPKGSFISFFGQSGEGKTSILRMIAGLMKPDDGQIQVDDQIWFDAKSKKSLDFRTRNIAFVFQDFALFPNMTIKENIAFAAQKNASLVDELIKIMELKSLENNKPAHLSGGQKQRVALSRALAQKPQILLLDEPMSSLDLERKTKLQDYLLKAHQKFGFTTILVSHDKSEIIKMADQVFVLKEGKIVKSGSPSQIFIPENKTLGELQLPGEILKIERKESLALLTLSFQEQIIQREVPWEKISDLKMGDHILLDVNLANSEIKKSFI